MIRGVTIHNFRGLRDVTLDGLARVNVIVGDNGSGKTALLEALFMATSNSALQALRLRDVRGLPSIGGEPAPALAAAFIGEGAKDARVDIRGDSRWTRTFTAAPDPTRRTHVVEQTFTPAGSGLPASNVVPIPTVYRWDDQAGQTAESLLRADKTPRAVTSGDLPALETVFLPANSRGQGGAAEMFSGLDKAGESGPFIDAIHAQFPDVEIISVQLEDNLPLLHARLKGQRQQRPLELLSGGLAGLSMMLLTISRSSTELVLIDEIENGLHHRRLSLLWRQVLDFATQAGTQVFATTHSLECLDAAADAMTEHPDDFALIRTARTDKGCVVGLLPGLEARHLLRSGLEVRG